MSKRHHIRKNRAQSSSVSHAAHTCCEPLESRWLLSAFTWTNRGTSSNDSDRFGAVFGTLANQARAVIDADLAYWSRVISNFNYSNGTNTFSLNISMNATAQGSGNGAVGANAFGGTTIGTNPAKPITSQVGIGWRSGITPSGNNAAGWYLDPSPMDNSEFTVRQAGSVAGNLAQTSAFTGLPTATANVGGGDMFTAVLHELGHAVGLSSNSTINFYATDTGFVDQINTPAAAPPAHLYRVDAGNSHTLWTAWDSGGANPNATNTNGAQHYAPFGTSVTQNGRTYTGSTALMNAYFTNRSIIDDGSAELLRVAYGYTVTPPSTFGTFYDRLDSNGTLTIQPPTGVSDQTVDISVVNTNLVVNIGVATPVAGIDPTTIQSLFPLGSVSSISVDMGAGSDVVTINPLATAVSISVDGGDGQDFIRIEGTGFNGVNVNGGPGDDFIDFSFGAKNLSNINSNVNVTGGTGYDQVYAYDNNSTLAKLFTITSGRFDRGGWGGFFYASDLEALNLITGTAADFVTVESTFANQPIWINSAGGADQVTVGNRTNGVQSIAADVNVANSPSFTALTISDFGDTTARNYNIDFNGPSTLGKINNLTASGARIIWTAGDLSGLRVETGSGSDSGIVYSNNVPITFDSTGGTDSLQIGDAAVGGTQYIFKPIYVTNHANFTALTISDAGNGSARTGTFDLQDSSTGRLVGFAPATITWNLLDTFGAKLITGNAADTVTILADTRGIDLDSAGGNDVVNVGTATTGLAAITSSIDVRNQHGQSAINVFDNPDTTARTINVSYNSFGVLNGLPPSVINWIAAETSTLSLTTGSGNDTINVPSMAANLALSSTGGSETLNIGNSTNGLNGVVGNISVANPPAFTTMNITDLANTAGRLWTFNSDATYGYISINPTATISYKLADTLLGPINMGNGSDNVLVQGVDTRALNLNGNGGNDVFTIGSAANTVDPINVALGIDGGAGTDSLIFNNAGDTTETGFTVTANVVSESDMATTTFSTCESLEIRGGTGAAPTHTFLNTPAGVAMTIKPGSSKDIIRTTGNGDWLTVKPSLGLDDVSVNDGLSASGGKVKFDTTIKLGTLTVKNLGSVSTVGTNVSVSVGALSTTGNAALDLSNNDLIVDYTGASQLAAIQSLINSARAGGAWTGAGITSTAAKNANPKNTTLGAIEASDFKSIYGANATFDGQSIDTTAVLIKYTYYGDSDFNGVVNFDDYSRTDAGFNGHKSGWLNGDFDGNSVVNFDDYSLIDLAFNTQAGALRNTRAPNHPAMPDQHGLPELA